METIDINKLSYNKIFYIFHTNNELNIYDSSANYDSIQIDFFVDKDGQVVVAPFQYSYYDRMSLASLLIADAFKEDVVKYLEDKNE